MEAQLGMPQHKATWLLYATAIIVLKWIVVMVAQVSDHTRNY
jgi:hypothetical protein